MEIRDATMNTGWIIVTKETDFHSKTTAFFIVRFLIYRIGEEKIK